MFVVNKIIQRRRLAQQLDAEHLARRIDGLFVNFVGQYYLYLFVYFKLFVSAYSNKQTTPNLFSYN
jgi:hypothetical protein